MLERTAILVGLLLALPASALAAEAPKLLSRGALLTERTTGDAYVRISPSEPARFLVSGPGRLEAAVRANLAAGGTPSPAEDMVVSIVLVGRPAGSLRIQPKASTDAATWKGETAFRPSEAVGFFIDLGPGPQICEVKVSGGPAGGAALLLVPAEKSKRPIAASAPVFSRGPASPVAAAASAAAAPRVVAAASAPSATPAVATATAPAVVTRTPSNPDTIPADRRGTAASPGSAGAGDARGRNAIFAGAGWVSQSEWDAFDDRRATDVVLAYRRSFSTTALAFAVTGEGRFGEARVRLVNDAPDARPSAVRDTRYALGLSGTWTRGLLRRGAAAVEGSVGLGYRLEVHDDELAPFVAGFAGPVLSLAARRGPARAIVSLEAGAPLHDSSPPSLDAGPIEGRLAWNAELRWEVATATEVVLGYRGEAMDRTHARRSSDGFAAGVAVGF